ncbi:MAG TPA: VOC family protein [Solirubrobacteraceae bacterium]|nr:VOC family protein [Solirubrobacteraceae bacterium]
MPHAFTHDHVGITLMPDDLDATIDWYANKLDSTLAQRYDTHGITFAFITNGNVKIELMSAASRTQGASTDNIFATLDPERLHHICLAVEDLDTTLSQLAERHVPPLGEPMDVPEIGQRIGFITDNIGNIIELTEPGT